MKSIVGFSYNTLKKQNLLFNNKNKFIFNRFQNLYTFNINKIVQYSNNLNINLNTDLSLINVYNSKLNTIFKYLFFKTFNFTNYNLLTINNIKLQILFHFLPYYNINLQVPKINTYLINWSTLNLVLIYRFNNIIINNNNKIYLNKNLIINVNNFFYNLNFYNWKLLLIKFKKYNKNYKLMKTDFGIITKQQFKVYHRYNKLKIKLNKNIKSINKNIKLNLKINKYIFDNYNKINTDEFINILFKKKNFYQKLKKSKKAKKVIKFRKISLSLKKTSKLKHTLNFLIKFNKLKKFWLKSKYRLIIITYLNDLIKNYKFLKDQLYLQFDTIIKNSKNIIIHTDVIKFLMFSRIHKSRVTKYNYYYRKFVLLRKYSIRKQFILNYLNTLSTFILKSDNSEFKNWQNQNPEVLRLIKYKTIKKRYVKFTNFKIYFIKNQTNILWQLNKWKSFLFKIYNFKQIICNKLINKNIPESKMRLYDWQSWKNLNKLLQKSKLNNTRLVSREVKQLKFKLNIIKQHNIRQNSKLIKKLNYIKLQLKKKWLLNLNPNKIQFSDDEDILDSLNKNSRIRTRLYRKYFRRTILGFNSFNLYKWYHYKHFLNFRRNKKRRTWVQKWSYKKYRYNKYKKSLSSVISNLIGNYNKTTIDSKLKLTFIKQILMFKYMLNTKNILAKVKSHGIKFNVINNNLYWFNLFIYKQHKRNFKKFLKHRFLWLKNKNHIQTLWNKNVYIYKQLRKKYTITGRKGFKNTNNSLIWNYKTYLINSGDYYLTELDTIYKQFINKKLKILYIGKLFKFIKKQYKFEFKKLKDIKIQIRVRNKKFKARLLKKVYRYYTWFKKDSKLRHQYNLKMYKNILLSQKFNYNIIKIYNKMSWHKLINKSITRVLWKYKLNLKKLNFYKNKIRLKYKLYTNLDNFNFKQKNLNLSNDLKFFNKKYCIYWLEYNKTKTKFSYINKLPRLILVNKIINKKLFKIKFYKITKYGYKWNKCYKYWKYFLNNPFLNINWNCRWTNLLKNKLPTQEFFKLINYVLYFKYNKYKCLFLINKLTKNFKFLNYIINKKFKYKNFINWFNILKFKKYKYIYNKYWYNKNIILVFNNCNLKTQISDYINNLLKNKLSIVQPKITYKYLFLMFKFKPQTKCSQLLYLTRNLLKHYKNLNKNMYNQEQKIKLLAKKKRRRLKKKIKNLLMFFVNVIKSFYKFVKLKNKLKNKKLEKLLLNYIYNFLDIYPNDLPHELNSELTNIGLSKLGIKITTNFNNLVKNKNKTNENKITDNLHDIKIFNKRNIFKLFKKSHILNKNTKIALAKYIQVFTKFFPKKKKWINWKNCYNRVIFNNTNYNNLLFNIKLTRSVMINYSKLIYQTCYKFKYFSFWRLKQKQKHFITTWGYHKYDKYYKYSYGFYWHTLYKNNIHKNELTSNILIFNKYRIYNLKKKNIINLKNYKFINLNILNKVKTNKINYILHLINYKQNYIYKFKYFKKFNKFFKYKYKYLLNNFKKNIIDFKKYNFYNFFNKKLKIITKSYFYNYYIYKKYTLLQFKIQYLNNLLLKINTVNTVQHLKIQPLYITMINNFKLLRQTLIYNYLNLYSFKLFLNTIFIYPSILLISSKLYNLSNTYTTLLSSKNYFKYKKRWDGWIDYNKNINFHFFNHLVTSFVEFHTSKKTCFLIHFNNYNCIPLEHRIILNMWIFRVNRFHYIFQKVVKLKIIMKLFYLVTANQDLHLLMKIITKLTPKIQYKSHRRFFKFIIFIFKAYFVVLFKNFNVKGMQFEFAGKISVTGNARTRKMYYKLGKPSKSTYTYSTKYIYKTIGTYMGVLGVKIWIFH